MHKISHRAARFWNAKIEEAKPAVPAPPISAEPLSP
jgi:hypothetical protein